MFRRPGLTGPENMILFAALLLILIKIDRERPENGKLFV
jgi:hypothetical protein